MAEEKNLICATSAVSPAQQPRVEAAFRVYKVAMREYSVVKGSVFIALEDQHEL